MSPQPPCRLPEPPQPPALNAERCPLADGSPAVCIPMPDAVALVEWANAVQAYQAAVAACPQYDIKGEDELKREVRTGRPYAPGVKAAALKIMGSL